MILKRRSTLIGFIGASQIDMTNIVAEEELIIESSYPEWELENEIDGVKYLIDFSITKRIVFKMSGKTYYFSLVRTESTNT